MKLLTLCNFENKMKLIHESLLLFISTFSRLMAQGSWLMHPGSWHKAKKNVMSTPTLAPALLLGHT